MQAIKTTGMNRKVNVLTLELLRRASDGLQSAAPTGCASVIKGQWKPRQLSKHVNEHHAPQIHQNQKNAHLERLHDKTPVSTQRAAVPTRTPPGLSQHLTRVKIDELTISATARTPVVKNSHDDNDKSLERASATSNHMAEQASAGCS